MKSPFHEHRLVALLILVEQYQKGDETAKTKTYKFYLTNMQYINNWDLVDLSVYKIVGDYLYHHSQKQFLLNQLAVSSNLWERRIAIIAAFTFIKNKNLTKTFKIASILVNDSHDLIHKAVGWILREAGKVDQKAEEKFCKSTIKLCLELGCATPLKSLMTKNRSTTLGNKY
ncbi:MAG: DNA alkylation repair protein [Patescibacteria group bacterium]